MIEPENQTERIAAYALGLLSPEESRDFEREMDTDPNLRAEVESYRQMLSEASGWMDLPAPGEDRLLNLTAPQLTPSTVPQGGTFPRWALQTAAAMAIFFIGFTAGREASTPPEEIVQVAPTAAPQPPPTPVALDAFDAVQQAPKPPRAIRTHTNRADGTVLIETSLTNTGAQALWIVDSKFRLEGAQP